MIKEIVKILPNKINIKNNNFKKTQVGIRPEFINFSNDGIQVKINRVSDTGRHKVIDAECSSGNIKILANSSTQIPSGSAHITFDQKEVFLSNYLRQLGFLFTKEQVKEVIIRRSDRRVGTRPVKRSRKKLE